jgi:cell division protein ZapA (FtsZ GTPase activity inhibitor)
MEDSSKMSLEVSILGQQVRIKHEDEEYVRSLEKYLNDKVEDAQNQQNITTLQLAARVLLVMADDYFSLAKEQEDVRKTVDDRAKRMIEFIDKKAALK